MARGAPLFFHLFNGPTDEAARWFSLPFTGGLSTVSRRFFWAGMLANQGLGDRALNCRLKR
jgi:hypothetical protein